MNNKGNSDPDSWRSSLFLSFNGSDREAVVEICRLLEGRGISTFLDEKDLVPGQPWPDALEQALAETGAVAVFLGRDGLGAWQKREMWFALDRQAQAEKAGAKFPVIPILLPGANPSAGFLFLNTWVDLRRGPDDLEALDRLARALHDGASTESKEPLSSICPYRGLEPFGEEDAAFFCGREAFSDRLLEAALKSSFVAVVGPSGSGKSSVVHAGLIPRLRRQRPPAPAWDAVSFTPGERPYHRLAAALLPLLEPEMSEVDRLKESAKLGDSLADRSIRLEDTLSRILEKSKGTGRLLLVADQFEELFTLTTGAAIWKRFADDLLAVTEKLPITLVLALRADFYDRALTFSRELSDRLEGALVNLGPMRREELARAIQEPATRVGLEFELGLVGRILDDVREEPGNLPLLEFALTELWARRSGGSLTNNAYRESGEVAGAIAQRAERDFEKLSPEQQRAAHRVFTELVRVARPEDGSRDTRRRAKLEDFEDAAQQVVARLAAPATRLLVTGRDEKGKNVVEVAHEALIQTWERLRRWLDEDLDFLLWRERLRAYLSDHERSGALLSGGPLAEANQWLGERRKDLGAEEATFIAASIKARDTERAAQARRQRRLILAGLGVAVLIAVLGAIAGWQAIRAKRQAEEARVDSILALQDSIQDPAVMALLALEIDQIPAPRAKASLDAVRFAQRPAMSMLPIAILRGHEEEVVDAAFSPDGTRVVTASSDGTARVWNAGGFGKPVIFRGHKGSLYSASFSRDGSRIVTASQDGTARIWHADGSGKPVILRGHKGPVWSATFSLDGSRVLTSSVDSARVWNTDGSGEPLIFREPAGSHLTADAAFNSAGSRIVTGFLDGTAWVWNADGSGKPVVLRGHKKSVVTVAFSPDGSRVLTAAEDGTARVWKTDGSGEPLVLRAHKEGRLVAAFSPDGSRILTALGDKTARVWNADGSSKPVVLDGQGLIDSADFSPDGSHVVTTSGRYAQVWNSDGSGKSVILGGHEEEILNAAFSPDGSHVVTASKDGTARVWNTDGPGEPVPLKDYNVTSAFFNPDGSRVLTISADRIVRIWNSSAFGEPVVLRGQMGTVEAAAFSPDGLRVLTASSDGTAWVWNTDGSGAPVVLHGHKDSVLEGAFSPDGSRVATASSDHTARIWSANGSGQPVVLRGHENVVRTAAFSPDGSKVLTTSDDGTARVWKADGSGAPVVLHKRHAPLRATSLPDDSGVTIVNAGTKQFIWKADGSGKPIELNGNFTLDGSRVITISDDGTAQLWNANGSGKPVVVGRLKRGVLAFSPESSRVVIASRNEGVQIWNTDGSGKPLVLSDPSDHVGALRATLSPDGSRILVLYRDGTVRTWRISWRALVEYLRASINACLTPGQRMQYLREPLPAAQAAFEACERRHSRGPKEHHTARSRFSEPVKYDPLTPPASRTPP